MPGVERLNDHGNLQEVRLSVDPQAWLRELVTRADVQHFEIARPSLHDIFLDIARPSPEEA
jgi:ABC-2 type transport system ATP-binding protein